MTPTYCSPDAVCIRIFAKDVRNGDYLDTTRDADIGRSQQGIDRIFADAEVRYGEATLHREGKLAVKCRPLRHVHVWRSPSQSGLPQPFVQPQRCPHCHYRPVPGGCACRPALCCRCVEGTRDRCDACCPPSERCQLNYIKALEALRDELQTKFDQERAKRVAAEERLRAVHRALEN